MRHPLLERLRRETSSLHGALENSLDLLRPGMTLAAYRTLLEGFYGFYAPWETKVAGEIDGVLPRFSEERRKTPLLERDLQFLQSEFDVIPRCLALPDTSSLPGVLGTLYVLEGSTLGGQVLTRHFLKQFGVSPAQGCSFFSSYGEAVGQRWRAFCERLAAYSAPETDSSIVHSAAETFRLLGGWLGRRDGPTEDCAFARLRFRPDPSAKTPNDLAADCQAQARP
jgi:heme oxygenase